MRLVTAWFEKGSNALSEWTMPESVWTTASIAADVRTSRLAASYQLRASTKTPKDRRSCHPAERFLHSGHASAQIRGGNPEHFAL
jgi:hypothetical protein